MISSSPGHVTNVNARLCAGVVAAMAATGSLSKPDNMILQCSIAKYVALRRKRKS
jgi:hypothetical protein